MCQNRIIWENQTCRDLRHRHFWSRWPTMVGIVLCVIALHCVYVVLIHWKSKYRNTAILKENHFHFLLACIQENVHQTIILSIQYFFLKKKLFWKFLMTFLHEFNKEFVLLWVFFFPLLLVLLLLYLQHSYRYHFHPKSLICVCLCFLNSVCSIILPFLAICLQLCSCPPSPRSLSKFSPSATCLLWSTITLLILHIDKKIKINVALFFLLFKIPNLTMQFMHILHKVAVKVIS